MNYLQNRLSVLKIILNSHYSYDGDSKVVNNIYEAYEETYKIKKKIFFIKSRKEKIKRIFNA